MKNTTKLKLLGFALLIQGLIFAKFFLVNVYKIIDLNNIIDVLFYAVVAIISAPIAYFIATNDEILKAKKVSQD